MRYVIATLISLLIVSAARANENDAKAAVAVALAEMQAKYPEPNPKYKNCGCAIGLPCTCTDCTCYECKCGEGCPGMQQSAHWQEWHNGWYRDCSTGAWWHAQLGARPANYQWAQPMMTMQPMFGGGRMGGACAGGG